MESGKISMVKLFAHFIAPSKRHVPSPSHPQLQYVLHCTWVDCQIHPWGEKFEAQTTEITSLKIKQV